MKYWVEQLCDWDDEETCWGLVMIFEFEPDAEAWIRRKCNQLQLSIKSFRIINVETDEIKYFE